MAHLGIRVKIENPSDEEAPEARAEVKVEPVEEEAVAGPSADVPEVAEEPEGPQKKEVKKKITKRLGKKRPNPNPRKHPPRVEFKNNGEGICSGPCAQPGKFNLTMRGFKICHPCLKAYEAFQKSEKKKYKVW